MIEILLEFRIEVVMVRVFDKDVGKNVEFEYFLISGSGGFFRIDLK